MADQFKTYLGSMIIQVCPLSPKKAHPATRKEIYLDRLKIYLDLSWFSVMILNCQLLDLYSDWSQNLNNTKIVKMSCWCPGDRWTKIIFSASTITAATSAVSLPRSAWIGWESSPCVVTSENEAPCYNHIPEKWSYIIPLPYTAY
jgi:hypothetical protein